MIRLIDEAPTVTTAGRPICQECSDPIEPEDPHTECWRASIAGAKIRG